MSIKRVETALHRFFTEKLDQSLELADPERRFDPSHINDVISFGHCLALHQHLTSSLRALIESNETRKNLMEAGGSRGENRRQTGTSSLTGFLDFVSRKLRLSTDRC